PSRDDEPKTILECRAHAKSGMVQVQAARELEVFDDRHEQNAAEEQRHEKATTSLLENAGTASQSKRLAERPSREQKKERHVPQADEAAHHQPAERQLVVSDVVEWRRVEDHADVEDEEEQRCSDSKQVDIVTAFHQRSSFARELTMKCTAVSFAISSSTVCGAASQCRWTAQKTSVSRTRRAATTGSGVGLKRFCRTRSARYCVSSASSPLRAPLNQSAASSGVSRAELSMSLMPTRLACSVS